MVAMIWECGDDVISLFLANFKGYCFISYFQPLSTFKTQCRGDFWKFSHTFPSKFQVLWQMLFVFPPH